MIIGKKFGYLDPKREAKWIDWEDGVSLLIAPANNNAYNRYMVENLSDDAMGLFTTGVLAASEAVEGEGDAAIEKAITTKMSEQGSDVKALLSSVKKIKEAAAKTILLDWKGFQDEDEEGNLVDVPYSPEQSVAYLDGYDALFKFVQDKANELAAAKARILEDTQKK